jgi:hypothetical protein
MRRLVVNLDNTLDQWLEGEINQNETVRKALYLYKDDISTPDTIHGLRKSYTKLTGFMETKFEYYDKVFRDLEKLINVLETRM